MGSLISDVMDKVGKDGVITVDESKSLSYETEFVEGMNIDRGYLSPYFVTNSERQESVLDDTYVLITSEKISAVSDLLPVLEKVLQTNKNILVIAEDVEGSSSNLGCKQIKRDFKCCCKLKHLDLVTEEKLCLKILLS